MDIVYIMSSARSGSTFLQFLLSKHPNVVGIGEVKHVLKEYCRNGGTRKSEQCSCGSFPEACQFWGPILSDLPKLPGPAGFKRILDQCEKLFPDKMLVDSSKSGVFLRDYYLTHIRSGNEMDIRIKVLFLVRDFRGWVLSIRKHLEDLGKSGPWNVNLVVNSYKWLYANTKWAHKLKKFKVSFLPVYYEHLVFDTHNQIKRISDFLELPDFFSRGTDRGNTHELYGSLSAKNNSAKGLTVLYDTKWMESLDFLLWGPFCLPVAMFNKRYAMKTRSYSAS